MPHTNNFLSLISQISEQVKAQLNQANSNEFEVALACAIKNWCNYLENHPNLNVLFTNQVTYNILLKCGQEPMPQLTYNIYQEWRNDKDQKSSFIPEALEVPTGFSLLINKILTWLRISDEDLNFTVLLAFVIVAVLFLNHIINTPTRTI